LAFCELGNIESSIVSSSEIGDLYQLCEFDKLNDWSLLYRATRDGFQSTQFHQLCDHIPNTLTIIKSTNGNIFGGFVSQTWDGRINTYKNDDKAFLFSLKNLENRKEKMPLNNFINTIYCASNMGPTFGSGHDISITNGANTNIQNYSKLGNSFRTQSQNPQSFLAGSYNFQVSEIEVFALSHKNNTLSFHSVALNHNRILQLRNLCQLDTFKKCEIVYRASRDGFQAQIFHEKCDQVQNTLTVICTTQNYIFGGFTSKAWDGDKTYKRDDDAFLFSLANPENRPEKLKTQLTNNSIYCSPDNGPTFGAGHDIFISNISNANSQSYSNLGNSYTTQSPSPQSYFAGARNFQVRDIEVFALS
jgi:hypothetical protein